MPDDARTAEDVLFPDMYGADEGRRQGVSSRGRVPAPAGEPDQSEARVDHPQRPEPDASSIDIGLNNGVVNTVRQIVNPDRPEEVGGFVVADHADVLGHYDRRDALIGGKPYNAGLFHSSAGFGDDEFSGLYRRVAQAILKTIPGAHCEEEAELDVLSIQPG